MAKEPLAADIHYAVVSAVMATSEAVEHRCPPLGRSEWTPGWTEAEAYPYYVAGIEGAKSEVGASSPMDRLTDKEHDAATGAIKAVLALARERGL